MSTAQTIREAAVTWPMPYLSDEESDVLWAFCGLRNPVDWGEDRYRTYMLIVAASLDGGERVPMNLKAHYIVDGRIKLHGKELNALIQYVEQHHGIGVSK